MSADPSHLGRDVVLPDARDASACASAAAAEGEGEGEEEGGEEWGDEIWDEEMEMAMQAAERGLVAASSGGIGRRSGQSVMVEPTEVRAEEVGGQAGVGKGVVDIEDSGRRPGGLPGSILSLDRLGSRSVSLDVQADFQGSAGVAMEVEFDEPVDEEGSEGEGEGDELERLIPFKRFRTRGFLSVTDLVGPVWCETQFDYRLRTPSYIPLEQRPEVITSTTGKEIYVDKMKVEEGAKVMRRGEKIHKRLERQIHGEEIKVVTKTREDVWGLRLLNMLSGFEALLTIGKCREMPVAGFVNGVLVMGVIDEITRQPLIPAAARPITRSKKDPSQTPLTAFFTAITPRPSPPACPAPTAPRARTHKLTISDSKTRTVPNIPKEEDSTSGRLQVMLYKELLDSILLACLPASLPAPLHAHTPDPVPEAYHPASNAAPYLPTSPTQPFSWERLYTHLDLAPRDIFSEEFRTQSKVVVRDNGLRWGAEAADDLERMVEVFKRYVSEMGLGVPEPAGMSGSAKEGVQWANLGRTDDSLELVYRRAGGTKKGLMSRGVRRKPRKPRESRKRRRGDDGDGEGEESGGGVGDETVMMAETTMGEEERMLQLAIAESLGLPPPTSIIASSSAGSVFRGGEDGTRQSREGEDSDLSGNDELFMSAMELGLGDEPGWVGQDQEVPGETGVAQVYVSPSKPPCTPPRTQLALAPPVPTTPATPSHRAPASPVPPTPTQAARAENVPSKEYQPAGSIIGISRFVHDPERLANHLADVLGFWMGERAPRGVEEKDAKRCGWCEFEEGCEWRLMKVEEHIKRLRR